jgi:hypothetical protein
LDFTDVYDNVDFYDPVATKDPDELATLKDISQSHNRLGSGLVGWRLLKIPLTRYISPKIGS